MKKYLITFVILCSIGLNVSFAQSDRIENSKWTLTNVDVTKYTADDALSLISKTTLLLSNDLNSFSHANFVPVEINFHSPLSIHEENDESIIVGAPGIFIKTYTATTNDYGYILDDYMITLYSNNNGEWNSFMQYVYEVKGNHLKLEFIFYTKNDSGALIRNAILCNYTKG